MLKSPSKNDFLNTLERLEAYGCTKNTKVQLEEMPHKQDIFLIKCIHLVQINVWELKSKIKILLEQGRMLYMKCILEVQSHVQIVKGREISLFFVLTC
jgi:hypothetical protein